MNRKLTDKQVKIIKVMIAVGYPNKHIAKEFGVRQNTISDIKHGRCWKHIDLDTQVEVPPVPTEVLKGKLDRDKVARVKLLMSRGYSNKDLAEMYNVSPGTISDIRRGVSWAEVEPEKFTGEEWEVPNACDCL